MSINIYIKDKEIILKYETNPEWFEQKRIKDQKNIIVSIGRNELFTFHYNDYLIELTHKNINIKNSQDIELEEYYFVLGTRQDNNYFLIEGRKLNIKQNVYLHKDININKKFFLGVKNVGIFEKIGNFLYLNDNKSDIYIGGNYENNISEKTFLEIVKKLPNDYELEKYIENRYAVVLSNYFNFSNNIFEKYEKYLNKRESIIDNNLNKTIKEPEIEKYKLTLEKLREMLQNEDKYIENQWQYEILDIILILFPKYLYAFKEAPVRDSYEEKNRRIDIILIDYNGNVDLIEIKRPRGKSIMSERTYRGNYLPQEELSGSIMQAEKYIYHLNKSGKSGEEKLNRRYKSEIMSTIRIKIKNPHSIMIMGRENNMSDRQKEDFEIIKRKYKNVIDIITYDDLLNRLTTVIKAWEGK